MDLVCSLALNLSMIGTIVLCQAEVRSGFDGAGKGC